MVAFIFLFVPAPCFRLFPLSTNASSRRRSFPQRRVHTHKQRELLALVIRARLIQAGALIGELSIRKPPSRVWENKFAR